MLISYVRKMALIVFFNVVPGTRIETPTNGVIKGTGIKNNFNIIFFFKLLLKEKFHFYICFSY